MVQPITIETILNKKYEHRKINDDLGFTGEWSLSVKDIIDIFIDSQSIKSDCKHLKEPVIDNDGFLICPECGEWGENC